MILIMFLSSGTRRIPMTTVPVPRLPNPLTPETIGGLMVPRPG